MKAVNKLGNTLEHDKLQTAFSRRIEQLRFELKVAQRKYKDLKFELGSNPEIAVYAVINNRIAIENLNKKIALAQECYNAIF